MHFKNAIPAILAFALTAISVGNGKADPINVSAAFKITNDTGQAANDFHITASSDTTLTLVSSLDGPFGPPTVTSNPTNNLFKNFDWSGGVVAAGDMATIGLTLSQTVKNKVRIDNAYWTNNGVQIDGMVPLGGFEVTPAGGAGGVMIRITNDSSSNMNVGNASFGVSPTATPLASLPYNGHNLAVTVPDFTVQANSFFDIFVTLPLPDGDFLDFEGQDFSDPAHSTVIDSFGYEHEHGTPEPSTLLMMLGGAGFLAAVAKGRSCKHANNR
jgi:hypothetical protein